MKSRIQPTEKRLGRLFIPDENDKKFLLKPLRDMDGLPTSKYWPAPQPLDQGNTPQCVAYATTHFLMSSPVINKKYPWSNIDDLYRECQKLDEWPGEDYEGTSVRGAMKVLKNTGFASGYEWAFDYGTAIKHLMITSPMVFGTDWYPSMFDVDKHGYVRVEGNSMGMGHAWMGIGANRNKRDPVTGEVGAIRCLNSWGRWGENGRFWMNFSTLEKLIHDNGEAAMPVELKA